MQFKKRNEIEFTEIIVFNQAFKRAISFSMCITLPFTQAFFPFPVGFSIYLVINSHMYKCIFFLYTQVLKCYILPALNNVSFVCAYIYLQHILVVLQPSALTMLPLSSEVPDLHEQGLCLRPCQSLHVSFRSERPQGIRPDLVARNTPQSARTHAGKHNNKLKITPPPDEALLYEFCFR